MILSPLKMNGLASVIERLGFHCGSCCLVSTLALISLFSSPYPPWDVIPQMAWRILIEPILHLIPLLGLIVGPSSTQ
jgi:hypothetical protein